MSVDQRKTAIWEELLTTAVFTPSPHNTQPWRLRIEDDLHATLFMERARTLPDEDLTGHFLRCAMGMFLESLRIISANAGLTLRSTLIFNENVPGPLIPFARLELKTGSQPSTYPNDLFRKRATSRLGNNGIPIDAHVVSLLKEFEPERKQRYEHLDDPNLIETIIQENIRAVFHDLNVPTYHDEIVRWLRYSDEEAQSKADGLDSRCMQTSPIELKLMKRLPQIMRWPLTRSIMRRMYRLQIGAVSHVGIISGPFFDDTAAVQAGAFLMRFWLELARQKLHIHPFGNLVTNPQAKDRIRSLTGINDIWLVFRIGHTAEPPRSYRLPLSRILVYD
jgi:hypothetical protein